MTAFILAIVAGLIGALPQILTLIEARVNASREKRNALAQLELQQTREAMDALDDLLLRRMQSSQRQPVLLPPDDRV